MPSSCRVYFSKEARSCGVFYQPPTLYKKESPKLLISLELYNSTFVTSAYLVVRGEDVEHPKHKLLRINQRLTLTESARKLFTAQIAPADRHYLSITTEEGRKEFYLEMRRCFNEEVLNSLDKSTILIFLTERVSTAFTAVKTKEIECLFENNSL